MEFYLRALWVYLSMIIKIKVNKEVHMYSIGIDIGTTNCKLCVFELLSLKLIDSYSFATPKINSKYGYDFDIEALYSQLEQGLIQTINSL